MTIDKWDIFCASWWFIGHAAARAQTAKSSMLHSKHCSSSESTRLIRYACDCGANVITPKFARVRACDRFEAGDEAAFCKCTFSVHAHTRAARRPVHYCNSCGAEFPGRANGYAMCSEHKHLPSPVLEVNR